VSARGETADVIVLGGGVIGLAVALSARERGMSVIVVERERIGSGASSAAAGMLAPVAEAEFGEAAAHMLRMGLRSAAMWPSFAARLRDATGEDVGLRPAGTLMVARDDDEARELERQIAFRESLGVDAVRLRASEARDREPALAPSVRLAMEAPNDHSVDPRAVLSALRGACERAGVTVIEQAGAARVRLDAREARVTGVVLGERAGTRDELLQGDRVVVASGAWSADLAGIPEHALVPVRPVRGQVLRLRDPAGAGLITRVVRVQRSYLVPRTDGRYVLGATVEERGFDLAPAAGGVFELLRDAHEVVPGVSELQIEELCVGLRPGTPDNLPVIGAAAIDGLYWATGHYRNGILLAPLTGELVAAVLAGEAKDTDDLLGPCAPGRFAAGSSTTPARDLAEAARL
jgi:glycine oxidase